MYLVCVLIYLVGLLAAGAWFSKRIKNSNSFFVADRALPWMVGTGTIVATFVGAGSLIGGAGLAYQVGISYMWMDIGGIIAIIAIAVMAGRIRRFEGLTTPEILGARFNSPTRVMAALIIIAAETAIVGYQIRAGGYILNLLSGMDSNTGMIVTALFIIGYTVSAGMISVAYTDLIQGVTILIALIAAFPYVLNAVGGMEGFRAALSPDNLDKLSLFGGSFRDAMKVLFPTFCLVFVMQPIWQRIFASKNDSDSRKAVFMSAPILLIIVACLAFIATAGSVLVPKLEDGGTVIISVAINVLPGVVAILMLCAAVAIIVSTGDSMLLSAASNVVSDIYVPYLNPKASEKHILLFTRVIVVILGLLAYVQIRFFPSVLAMVIYAYTMEGGLAPALVAAFYWKRASSLAGFLCVFSAGITTVVWEYYGYAAAYGIDTAFMTIGVSTALLILVSLVTPAPGEDKLRRFEYAGK